MIKDQKWIPYPKKFYRIFGLKKKGYMLSY